MLIINESVQNTLTMVQSCEEYDIICPDIYGTLGRANRYFDNRLRNIFWIEASLDDKKKALIEATTIIDTLNYVGEKTDDSQIHQFPRKMDLVVPRDVELACYEIAIQLLSGIDPEMEVENLAAHSQGFSSARTTYERAYVLDHIAAGVPSARAWNLLKPYLRDPRRINLSRVD